MKILHIVPSILSGGVVSVVYNLIRFQRKEGNIVNLYVASSELKYRLKEPLFKDIGVVLNYSKYPNVYDPRHIKEIKELLEEYDIVHVHLFPQQMWTSIAYRCIKNHKRPIIITTEHNTFNNRRKYPLFRYFDRFIYKPYHKIISISDQTKVNLDNWLKSPNISSNNIVISNGVDINKIYESQPADLSFLNLPEKTKKVVMVARLIHPKDPLTLVSAIKSCPSNIHAIFIGYGPMEDKVKTLAEDLGINNRIHLLGLRDDVPSIIKSCDLGVLSTFWDGFGLVSVEYMAAGIPVLASDVDGLRDVVGNKGCLFPVGDHYKLASLITSIFSDEKRYEDLQSFFANRCKSFNIDKTNEDYYKMIKELTKNTP